MATRRARFIPVTDPTCRGNFDPCVKLTARDEPFGNRWGGRLQISYTVQGQAE